MKINKKWTCILILCSIILALGNGGYCHGVSYKTKNLPDNQIEVTLTSEEDLGIKIKWMYMENYKTLYIEY